MPWTCATSSEKKDALVSTEGPGGRPPGSLARLAFHRWPTEPKLAHLRERPAYALRALARQPSLAQDSRAKAGPRGRPRTCNLPVLSGTPFKWRMKNAKCRMSQNSRFHSSLFTLHSAFRWCPRPDLHRHSARFKCAVSALDYVGIPELGWWICGVVE
jgi:hypothetical protein